MDGPAGPRTLAELLPHAARLAPRRTGVITPAGTITFAELESRALAAARGLAAAGIRRGDRVAIHLPNGLEYLLAFHAVPAAGGVTVPVNTFLAVPEVVSVLEDSSARCLVTTRRCLAALAPEKGRLPGLRLAVLLDEEEGRDGGDGARAPLPSGIEVLSWRAVAAGGPAAPPAAPDPRDTAILTYTSGTTGRMKGVILTHANLIANARSCLEAVKLRDRDRLLLFLPMFHSLTQLVCVILPPIAALPVVVLPGVDRDAIRSALRRHRPTIFIAVPAIYAAMAEKPPGRLHRWLNPVRLYLSGGAPLPVEVMRRFEEGWRRPLCEGYGLSEAAPVVSLNPVDGERRPGSVGRPVPGVGVRIAAPGGGDAPAGEIGEIAVRGPNVMGGYHERPEETAAALRDGWLFTGDLGRLDADGYLYIVGRRKEVLLYRGMNVYPREVEEVLAAHPAVAEAAVVGLEDPRRGEVPHAAVALRPGAAATERDLLAHCRERLARYKVPREIRILPALPRNATGKVLKDAVRETILAARAEVPAAAGAAPES
jgi:long-chain acyl-CoA synthetase